MQYDLRVRDLTARGTQQAALHEQAVAAAFERFGRWVFLRGVVEVFNFCRQNCHCVGMRRDSEYVIYNRDRCIMGEERAMTAIAREQLEPSMQSLVEFLGNGLVHHEAEGVAVGTR